MNEQIKILENKTKQIANNIDQLTIKLNDRNNYLCRNDPVYQKFAEEIRMEKIRLSDMKEFTEMLGRKQDEQSGPGTSQKTSTEDKEGEPPKA